jgi:hypothetical protein
VDTGKTRPSTLKKKETKTSELNTQYKSDKITLKKQQQKEEKKSVKIIMLNSANMYPWYRDSMSQLGQFCSAGTNLPAPTAAHIKTENGYNDCMLALDYAQNKVRRTLFDFHLPLLRRSPINAVSISASIC